MAEHESIFDFDSEFKQLYNELLKQHENNSVNLSKIIIKVGYAKNQLPQAYKALQSFPVDHAKFEDVFFFFVRESLENIDTNGNEKPDKRGLAIAADIYFNSKFKDDFTNKHSEYYLVSMLARIHQQNLQQTNRKHVAQRFKDWWNLHKIESIPNRPYDILIRFIKEQYNTFKSIDHLRLDSAQIEEIITSIQKQEIQQDQGEINHEHLRDVCEASKGMAMIKKSDQALQWIEQYKPDFDALDKKVRDYAKELKDPTIVSGSVKAEYLYAKAKIYVIRACPINLLF